RKAGAKKPGAGARIHGFGLEQYRNLVKPYVSGTIAPTPPGFVRIRIASFCLETLSNGRCAVIDRAYSVDSATVGAVYDRPICSFETETSYWWGSGRDPKSGGGMRCFVAASYAEAIRNTIGSEKGRPKNMIPTGSFAGTGPDR